METLSALLAICAGNSPVTGEFPTKSPMTWSFDVFFDLRLNKRLSKQRHHAHYDVPVMSHPKSNHDRVRVTNLKKNGKSSKFCKENLHTTHLLDTMCKYEMKWVRLILYCGNYRAEMTLSTDGQTDRRIWWNLLQLCWTGNIFIYFCSISDAYDKSIIFIIFYSLGHIDCKEMLSLVWRGSHSVGIWLGGKLGLITT